VVQPFFKCKQLLLHSRNLQPFMKLKRLITMFTRTHHRPRQHSRYTTSLQAERSGDRIPVGARFSTPIHTSSKAHPASYTMGTRSFLRVKGLERGIYHPPPSGTKVKERVDLYLYSRSVPSWQVIGWTLPLQGHTTGLYLKPDASSLYPHTPF
jgi:hypothetical protein